LHINFIAAFNAGALNKPGNKPLFAFFNKERLQAFQACFFAEVVFQYQFAFYAERAYEFAYFEVFGHAAVSRKTIKKVGYGDLKKLLFDRTV
jgi:hypothetical protein